MRIAALVFLLVTAPAAAELCKYADAEGNVHYSNVAPSGPDWQSLGCATIGDDTARLDAAWRAARAKIKIGMTASAMRAADPLLRHHGSRRVLETAAGKIERLEFYDFTVVIRNDRVVSLIY